VSRKLTVHGIHDIEPIHFKVHYTIVLSMVHTGPEFLAQKVFD